MAPAGSVWAEGAGMSLSEFSQRVGAGLPEHALVEAGLLEVEADIEQASTLPELGVSLERQQVYVGGEGVVLQNSATLDWSIDVSGRRGLRIDAAKAGLRAARLRGQTSHAGIEIEATAVYWEAARARQMVERLESTREPLAKLTKTLKRRSQAGDASGADLARFELALAKHDAAIANAKASREVAEARLGALLGKQGPVVATDDLTLPSRSSTEVPARPDLRATQEDAAGGRALVKAADRWWIPTVGVSGGYLFTDFGPGTGPGSETASGYLATLSLSVPIFSRNQAEKKRGQAQVARAEATRQLLARRIDTETRAAKSLLASRLQQVKTHEETRMPLAATMVQKTEAAYAGGEASALELRDAYEQSIQADLDAIELRHQARLAELALWRAQGTKPKEAVP